MCAGTTGIILCERSHEYFMNIYSKAIKKQQQRDCVHAELLSAS